VVAKTVVLVAVLNHATVAFAGGVANNGTVPVPHRLPLVTEGAGGADILTVTGTRVRVEEVQVVVRAST
jgi:hypothetical protein